MFIQKPSDKDEIERSFNRYMEKIKLTNDYFKHIATLDTASILVIATFIGKGNSTNIGGPIAAAIACLILSLIVVGLAQGILVLMAESLAEDASRFSRDSDFLDVYLRYYKPIAFFLLVAALMLLGIIVFVAVSK